MKLLYNSIFLSHDTGTHPENKKRLEALGTLDQTQIESGEKYLTLIHTIQYIRHVKEACTMSERLDTETLTSPGTYEAAIQAVGATVAASESGDFALVRPPGHHAHPDHSEGFCIFNNIAIAAQKLVTEGKRVAIFDFDGHLGDGTEKFFYKTNKVLYWSIHQHPAFPGEGTIDQIGEGDGKGYTINIPMLPGSGDDIYMQSVDTILPILKQFVPDVIGFSAGFDGYQFDPLLRLRISVNTYYDIGSRFRLLGVPLFAVLEGGYNLEALPKCIRNFLAGINGEVKPYSEESTDTKFLEMEEFDKALQQLKETLSPYWKL